MDTVKRRYVVESQDREINMSNEVLKDAMKLTTMEGNITPKQKKPWGKALDIQASAKKVYTKPRGIRHNG